MNTKAKFFKMFIYAENMYKGGPTSLFPPTINSRTYEKFIFFLQVILISLHNCDEFNQMTYLKAGYLLLFSVGATVNTTCKNHPALNMI